jgi:hypothetical protein
MDALFEASCPKASMDETVDPPSSSCCYVSTSSQSSVQLLSAAKKMNGLLVKDSIYFSTRATILINYAHYLTTCGIL